MKFWKCHRFLYCSYLYYWNCFKRVHLLFSCIFRSFGFMEMHRVDMFFPPLQALYCLHLYTKIFIGRQRSSDENWKSTKCSQYSWSSNPCESSDNTQSSWKDWNRTTYLCGSRDVHYTTLTHSLFFFSWDSVESSDMAPSHPCPVEFPAKHERSGSFIKPNLLPGDHRMSRCLGAHKAACSPSIDPCQTGIQ